MHSEFPEIVLHDTTSLTSLDLGHQCIHAHQAAGSCSMVLPQVSAPFVSIIY